MMQDQKTLAYGQLLPEFVAARGLAAVAIVAAHALLMTLRGHAETPYAVEYARLIVDFFFVQSGFVLAHIYDKEWAAGRFSYPVFLSRRIARLWPLHAFMLLVVAGMVFAGRHFGHETENPHTIWTFLATLFMFHSAWATTDLAWNWPSWSVSAEWCAYLMIPLYFGIADRVRGPIARISVALASFTAAAVFSAMVLHEDLTTLTFDGGAFRLIPSFLTGVLLRRLFDEAPGLFVMTPRRYALTVAGVTIVCAILILMRAPYATLWPAMVVLVAALAARGAQAEPGLLRGRVLAWLGELSYAIYLTHAIVLQIAFTGAKYLELHDSLIERACLGVVAVALTPFASYAAYVLVEKPGRGMMAKLFSLGRRRPAVPAE